MFLNKRVLFRHCAQLNYISTIRRDSKMTSKEKPLGCLTLWLIINTTVHRVFLPLKNHMKNIFLSYGQLIQLQCAKEKVAPIPRINIVRYIKRNDIVQRAFADANNITKQNKSQQKTKNKYLNKKYVRNKEMKRAIHINVIRGLDGTEDYCFNQGNLLNRIISIHKNKYCFICFNNNITKRFIAMILNINSNFIIFYLNK